METTILHISDLHISNPALSDPAELAENLRFLKYKEYIDDLYKSCITAFDSSPLLIDYLFVTGDFIDKGSVKNFSHATDVINYIISKFSIAPKKAFVCVGNHDILRDEEKAGKSAEAIADYIAFEQKYNSTDFFIEKHERATLYKVNDDYIIIFDPVSNTGGSDRPAINITNEFIDYVGGHWVRDDISPDSNLYLLSHYPLVQSKNDLLDYEENDWSGRHKWKAGFPIKNRIANIREDLPGKTIWFFGDAHIPDFVQDKPSSSVYYLMTGQFGGKYANPVSAGRAFRSYHQASILIIKEAEIKRLVFSYDPSGFEYSPHIGDWTPKESSFSFIPSKHVDSSIAISSTTATSTTTTTSSTPLPSPIPASFILPVGTSIEESIYEEIKNEKLYKFGKFVTSEENVALGWVSINNLFSNTFLLSNGIDKLIEWLQKTIFMDDKYELFIGCGFWGGILAANISIRTNIPSYTISSFVDSPNNCSYEETIDCLIEKISHLDKIKRIVVFTDVISSGNTLLLIKKKIEDTLKRKYEWLAATVLVDDRNLKQEFRESYSQCGALCTKLKMPVINRELLPNEEISPAQLNFTIE